MKRNFLQSAVPRYRRAGNRGSRSQPFPRSSCSWFAVAVAFWSLQQHPRSTRFPEPERCAGHRLHGLGRPLARSRRDQIHLIRISHAFPFSPRPREVKICSGANPMFGKSLDLCHFEGRHGYLLGRRSRVIGNILTPRGSLDGRGLNPVIGPNRERGVGLGLRIRARGRGGGKKNNLAGCCVFFKDCTCATRSNSVTGVGRGRAGPAAS